MKTAGVREIKARFSAWLREVQRGEVVLVTDRGRVVAELRPPGAGDRSISRAELRTRRLAERGLLRPSPAPEEREWATGPLPRLPAGTAEALLAAERDE